MNTKDELAVLHAIHSLRKISSDSRLPLDVTLYAILAAEMTAKLARITAEQIAETEPKPCR